MENQPSFLKVLLLIAELVQPFCSDFPGSKTACPSPAKAVIISRLSGIDVS
jgi:hypothetical protein